MNGQLENVDISSVTNYTPTSAKTFAEFTSGQAHKGMADDNYGIFGNLADWFTGRRTKNEKDYETYLQNLNAENAYKANELAWKRELEATQSAREWDKMMSDTQYQRAVVDLKKAGLNPWLALQSGVSGSDVPSSGKAQASTSKSSNYGSKEKSKTSGMRDASLLLFAIARLLA